MKVRTPSMNRTTALTDAIRRTVAYGVEALDAIGKPGYDYDLCADTALRSLQEQSALSQEYQKYLDAGTLLEEIEVYTKTTRNAGTHALVEYWRLMPGHTEPEQLSSYDGFFDFLDAEKERAMRWHNAVYVSSGCFDMSVSGPYKQRDTTYRLYFAAHMPAPGNEPITPSRNEQDAPVPGNEPEKPYTCVECGKRLTFGEMLYYGNLTYCFTHVPDYDKHQQW